MKLVFCTHNDHKISEVAQIMGPKFKFLKPDEVGFFSEIEEPFDTLEANSAIKAQTVFAHCNISCFAEDTGLFIDSLNGEPGVYSARYAGEPYSSARNIEKVLQRMEGISNRSAYFKTVITLVTRRGQWQFEGICKGNISTQVVGSDGFGYDPVFIPENHELSFAEMDSALKNSISHRKKAFDIFSSFLNNYSE